MDPHRAIERLLARRSELIDELVGYLTISEASWDGDPQTVVRLDRLLVTSMVVRHDAAGALRGEYTVMLWYLLMIVAAIDRCTVKRGRVGVLADNAIILTPDELQALGLRQGPSTKHGGHADRHYYELST